MYYKSHREKALLHRINAFLDVISEYPGSPAKKRYVREVFKVNTKKLSSDPLPIPRSSL
jgi:hypothetical protein